jgi:RNA polymerase sigma-70 factor (ECF subfamily)
MNTMTAENESIEMSDYTLAQRAAKSDVHAFQELYLRHNRRVYLLCLRMTANTAESEDLAQEVFIKVLRYIGGFRGESAFKTWLLRVASNHVLMHFHKRRLSLEQITEDGETPVQVIRGTENHKAMRIMDRIALDRAVAQLPAGYRTVFTLYHIEGYEHREIAGMMGHSVATSKSQLFKARRKLRALLLQKYGANVV